MRKFWLLYGRILFEVSVPLIQIYVGSSKRTRVMVIHNKKILVTKAWLSDGKWSLPGGGLHRREVVAAGAVRELHEETGLQLKAEILEHKGTYKFQNHGIRFDYELFRTTLTTTPTLKRQFFEITDVAWVNPAQLTMKNAAPDVLQALRSWPL